MEMACRSTGDSLTAPVWVTERPEASAPQTSPLLQKLLAAYRTSQMDLERLELSEHTELQLPQPCETLSPPRKGFSLEEQQHYTLGAILVSISLPAAVTMEDVVR